MWYRLTGVIVTTALLWPALAVACVTLNEPQKIGRLLTVIENADMQFIRGGSAFDGKAARKHLEEKLHYAGGKITTAEQFIHYIGSKSSLTGEAYHIRFPDGKKMESEAWLNQQLSIIESNECVHAESHNN